MFSKDEEKALRNAFWGTLTTRMQKKRGVSGRRLNWFKYPTGLRDIYVRTEIDDKGCRIAIDLQFKNPGIRALFYDQFLETKTVFENTMETPVRWKKDFKHISGSEISRISVELEGVKLLNQEDWPKMHDFIATHLVKVDKYWEDFGELYKTLHTTN